MHEYLYEVDFNFNDIETIEPGTFYDGKSVVGYFCTDRNLGIKQ